MKQAAKRANVRREEKHPALPPPKNSVTVHIRAPIEGIERARPAPETMVAVFDENGSPLANARVERGVAKVVLPAAQIGHMVQVFHAPVDDAVEKPSPARLRRSLAVEERLLVERNLAVALSPARLKYWLRSCCRVRGRVFIRVTLPNGSVQERPLCNARVVICEVDSSISWIVRTLPNELLYRLRDEWLSAVRVPPIGPDPAPEAHLVRAGLAAAFRGGDAAAMKLHAPVLEIERLTSPALIREGLLARVDLLRPYWCVFDWLSRFYSLDCIKTVALNEDGTFDTEIFYPCYGDHPDLYFKVEQDCHPGWLTVYAPSVQCNTYWDYCCGSNVNIQVTHPAAVPGRAAAPCAFPFVAGSPASVGSWELLPYTSGVFVVHAALLRTGKVLLWSGTAEVGLPEQSRVWDPITGVMTSQAFGLDLFCAGHAMLPDGRILVNGGANNPGQGIKATHIFDPATETWTRVQDMNHARWYPTTLTLPNGKIITFSGRNDTGSITAQVEVYDPAADTWTDLPASADKVLELYPSLHVMPNGKILYTGTRWAGSQPWPTPPLSSLFDPAINAWTDVAMHVIPNRTEGTSILLPALEPSLEMVMDEDMPKPPKTPPTLSRVLVVGGPGGAPAEQKSAEIIDMSDGVPAWRRIADMNFPRVNVNGVILPDGKVLFCTGIDGYKWGPNVPTLAAEIFDPQAETWTAVASMSVGRQYHSVSVLLPDGRVLNTGSVGGPGNVMSMEVYSPPYLFRGPRPTISSSPAAVAYGANFLVESPDACRIDKIALVRATTITHHTNTDQRYLRPKWRREGHCGFRITAPANANIAPPGYYLLFLLDDCGIPSVARLIRIGS